MTPSPAQSTAAADATAARTVAAWQRVVERIDEACRAAGRAPGSVRLLAVSKTFGADLVAALGRAGQLAFGENYVQEAVAKMDEVALRPGPPPLEWHFIGPIQSNKTRAIAERFAWVQSVDRIAIAERLSAQRPAGRPPLEVLLEVNISAEASKSGVDEAGLDALAARVAELPNLRLRGIMAIPAPEATAAGQRAAFGRLRALFERLRLRHGASTAGTDAPVPRLDTLSMGMSSDFEAAIAEGSTLVRVGSAIFGERK